MNFVTSLRGCQHQQHWNIWWHHHLQPKRTYHHHSRNRLYRQVLTSFWFWSTARRVHYCCHHRKPLLHYCQNHLQWSGHDSSFGIDMWGHCSSCLMVAFNWREFFRPSLRYASNAVVASLFHDISQLGWIPHEYQWSHRKYWYQSSSWHIPLIWRPKCKLESPILLKRLNLDPPEYI